MTLAATDAIKEDRSRKTLKWLANHQFGNSADMIMGTCVIKVGCTNPLHPHPNCERILSVLKTTIACSWGGKFFEMLTGDLSPQPIHKVNISIGEATLFTVFSNASRRTQML